MIKSRARKHGARAVPMAMILFALFAVSVGLSDPSSAGKPRADKMTLSQMQQAQADIKFGFARQTPGEKLRIDPF